MERDVATPDRRSRRPWIPVTVVTDAPARNVFFAAPADDPRARRPTDVGELAVSVLAVAWLMWSHRVKGDLDTRVLQFFDQGLPGWISGIATIVFIVGGLYGLGLVIGIAVFGRGRGKIVRDMVVAVALAGAAIAGAAYLAGPEFPDLIPELFERDGYPSFPVARLALTVALIRVVGPYQSAPVRKIGQRLLIAMSVAALVLSYGTVTAVIGGLAVGFGAAAAVHLIFGSGRGIPSRDRIRAALREANVEVDEIEYAPHQPVGATLVIGTRPGGGRARIKVYGRDAADAAFAARAWRATWYRDSERSVASSRMQLAEHEALTMLALRRAGVPVPGFIGASRSSTDDILVVSEWVDGRPFVEFDSESATDEILDRVWTSLLAQHAVGVAHRAIDREQITITDTAAVFTDLTSTDLVSTDASRRADLAQMLVATALAVGGDRAIPAARRHVDDDRLLSALPLMQTGVLPRALQRDVKDHDLSVKELRSQLASEIGVDTPELAQLRRVSWGTVAMLALTLFAAYSLIGSLTDIGFDTIAEEMSEARWGWVLVALTMAQLTNIGEYFSLVGVMGQPVPFGPTMMFRYALSFISLAVPSDAGAIAMNVRYQQKLGVPPAAAVAQGPLLTIVSKATDLILLLITAQFVSANVDTDAIDAGPMVKLLIAVVVAVVIAIVVVLAVPKWRATMLPHVKEGFSAVKGSLTDPERLSKVLGGTLLQKMLFAITLAASVAAYGEHLPFAAAIFVNTAVSLVVGLMPVPGGIGVGEAALTAGLIAVGIPEEVAIAAAITHRIVTAYLPPVFGWWSSRWLTERDYL